MASPQGTRWQAGYTAHQLPRRAIDSDTQIHDSQQNSATYGRAQPAWLCCIAIPTTELTRVRALSILTEVAIVAIAAKTDGSSGTPNLTEVAIPCCPALPHPTPSISYTNAATRILEHAGATLQQCASTFASNSNQEEVKNTRQKSSKTGEDFHHSTPAAVRQQRAKLPKTQNHLVMHDGMSVAERSTLYVLAAQPDVIACAYKWLCVSGCKTCRVGHPTHRGGRAEFTPQKAKHARTVHGYMTDA
jgi:hypothetical protein